MREKVQVIYMELFDKIYGCYYNIIRRILKEAREAPLSRKELEQISSERGFQESALTIVPNLTQGVWPFLKEESGKYRTVFPLDTRCPLTSLQKSWLKSLLKDEKLPLFLSEEEIEQLESKLSEVSPLYDENDFYYFDRYRDRDAYGSLSYKEYFHNILTAIEANRVLTVSYAGRNDVIRKFDIAPYQLQYSPKDDKFRLCGLEHYRRSFSRKIILNLGKLVCCQLLDKHFTKDTEKYNFSIAARAEQPVVLEISGERNSLERCMLHFASYEKHTEYDESRGCFVCSIWYDPADQTELLIEVLSFGPVVRVVGPEEFLYQLKKRVRLQHERFYGDIDPGEEGDGHPRDGRGLSTPM